MRLRKKTHHLATQRLANLNFFVRDGVFNFWRETIFKESFVNIVVRGNSVQIVPNFPAKSLSIYIRLKIRENNITYLKGNIQAIK